MHTLPLFAAGSRESDTGEDTMEMISMWLGLGVAVVVAVIAAIMLQKKSAEIARKDEELQLLAEELTAARALGDKNRLALEKLEQEFESKMDDVVESSIQKITHAEQAREEAVQAAKDNYEAAAEVHALLKEKEALILKLQSHVSG